MIKSFAYNLAFSLVLMLLTGCGESVIFKPDITSILSGGCQVSLSKIKQIHQPEFQSEINCLERKLTDYAKGVKRQDQRYINRAELKEFVDKFSPELADGFEEGSKLLFSVHAIIFRENNEYLTVKNIHSYFNVLRHLNRLLVDVNNSKYWQARHQINVKILNFKNHLKGVIGQNRLKQSQQLDLLKTLREVLGEDYNEEVLTALLSFKKLFIGGSPYALDSSEVDQLADKLDSVFSLVLDIYNLPSKEFKVERDKNLFFVEMLSRAQSNFYPHKEQDVITTTAHILLIMEEFFPNQTNENMSSSIVKVKERIIGGDPLNLNLADFKKIVDITSGIFENLYFSDLTFEVYRDQLLSPEPLKSLEFESHPKHSKIDPDRLKKFWKDFERVATTHRTFRQEDNIRIYSREYLRTRYGVQSAVFLRWILDILGEAFGSYNGKSGLYEISRDQIKDTLTELQGVFELVGLWPVNTERFIQDTIDTSDLFQVHSDGNLKVDMNELGDYLDATLSSSSIMQLIKPKMEEYCPVLEAELSGFDTLCFREKLLDVLFNDLELETKYPELVKYLNALDESQQLQYLEYMEKIGRIQFDNSIPVFDEDVTRIITALDNTENIFLLYDEDNSGVLEYAELSNLYPRFKKRIKEKGSPGFMAKSVFFYLVEYGYEPGTFEAMGYHLGDKKKHVSADRNQFSKFIANNK